MLYQDVQSQVVPYDARGRGFRVKVEPETAPGVREALTQGLGQESDRYDLEDAVEAWLREAASELVLCGKVAYEIVYLMDQGTGDAIAFELASVPAGSLFRRWGHQYQYVPRMQDQRRRVVRLDSSRLIVAQFSRRHRRRMQHAFAALDMATEFTSATSELVEAAMFRGLPYDFSEHRQGVEVAVARSTSIFGWDARTTFADRQLEPYRIWRQIRFEAFKIELREVLVDALNDGLARVGRRLGWGARLELEGLPTRGDIQQAESDLRDGACGVDEILRRFHPWLGANATDEDEREEASNDSTPS